MYSSPNRPAGSVYSGYSPSTMNKSYLASEYTGYSRLTARTMGASTVLGQAKFNTKSAIQKGLKYWIGPGKLKKN